MVATGMAATPVLVKSKSDNNDQNDNTTDINAKTYTANTDMNTNTNRKTHISSYSTDLPDAGRA